jgi:phospholipase/carboxylesterase
MKITRRGFLRGAGVASVLATTRGRSWADELGPGQYPLKLDYVRDGLVYVPRSYKPGVPTPLVVGFHGAGSTALSCQYMFPMADEFNFIVLATDSRDERTWDIVLGENGPDSDFLEAALQQTIGRCSVDRRRLTIAGHSDGASYGLSFGIGAGNVFGHILAFSPGVMTPYYANGKPKIFISHGLDDRVMPIDDTSRKFVPRLRGLGYDVTYREYEGRHGVPTEVVHEGFVWLTT